MSTSLTETVDTIDQIIGVINKHDELVGSWSLGTHHVDLCYEINYDMEDRYVKIIIAEEIARTLDPTKCLYDRENQIKTTIARLQSIKNQLDSTIQDLQELL